MITNLAVILGTFYGLGCATTTALVFWNWARRSVPDEGRSAFFAAWTGFAWPITLWFLVIALLATRGAVRTRGDG